MDSRARRVLIVEDDGEIASSMADLLRDEGLEVACAATGREALEYLETTPELPDVILLDLMMPDLDGFQFRAAQLRDARLSAIPIVLMTAGGDIQAKARALGARAYLKKPFKDLASILEAVRDRSA